MDVTRANAAMNLSPNFFRSILKRETQLRPERAGAHECAPAPRACDVGENGNRGGPAPHRGAASKTESAPCRFESGTSQSEFYGIMNGHATSAVAFNSRASVEVAEWLNAPASKSGRRLKTSRGFESRPLHIYTSAERESSALVLCRMFKLAIWPDVRKIPTWRRSATTQLPLAQRAIRSAWPR